MKLLATYFNWRARKCHNAGKAHEAIKYYKKSIASSPDWSVPRYNLGLLHKYRGEWSDSYACNSQALRLAADDEATLWNTGIAATALGLWKEARAAWTAYGVEIPPGSGPIEMDLGTVPIRINAEEGGEVVWCRRIDPARAIILCIPLAQSGHAYGDLLLHDGAAVGYRMRGDTQIPVFNSLAILTPSAFFTFSVHLNVQSKVDLEDFERECLAVECFNEDWSTSLRIVCRACSEGHPHAHEEDDQPAEKGNDGRHHFGLAADSLEAAQFAVSAWLKSHPACAASEIEVLASPAERKVRWNLVA